MLRIGDINMINVMNIVEVHFDMVVSSLMFDQDFSQLSTYDAFWSDHLMSMGCIQMLYYFSFFMFILSVLLDASFTYFHTFHLYSFAG